MIKDVPVPIFLYDENFSLISGNTYAVALFGFVMQTEGENAEEELQKLFAAAFGIGAATADFVLQKTNGTSAPVKITAVRTSYDGQNAIAAYIQDLTDDPAETDAQRLEREKTRLLFETKETERQLLREMKKVEQSLLMELNEGERQQLKATLDSSPLVCVVFDKEHTVLSVNQKAEAMFEIPDKQLFVDYIKQFMPEVQPTGMDSAREKAMRLRAAFKSGRERFEFVYQTINGTPLPCDVTAERVRFSNEEFVLVYLRDLREQKEMLAKLEDAINAEQMANKEKTRFLARMSHEIRTPMHSILGITEVQLQKETHPKETEDAFQRIYSSSNMLLALINDILDFSKIEAGKMEIVSAPYDVANMIINIVQLNQVYIGDKKINFKLSIAENLPASLIGDELRMKQILNNFLSNAFKYTPEGDVHLSFGLDVTGALAITVADTGQGMTQEEMDNLSGEFLRYNPQFNRKIEGTGLGLNIAYHLINMMSGTVSVESAPGKGSVFIIRLPQKQSGTDIISPETIERLESLHDLDQPINKPIKLERTPMPYGRVLIVDDIEANLYVAEAFLEPYELTIELVDSGLLAIEKIKAGEVYDIILMDHMMPELDGVETTKVLRGMGYTNPIIVLTANAYSEMSEIYETAGFTAYASKPLDIAQMDALLTKYIKK
ncbi:MAG: ATP-binding protein [Defluviitaleaceae bacterium]|nr:ATP-binding protein [Defluviitaleaceae bacterium]MCL2262782.1 ATP-binding protein [Defluviitaleaceae bacterium]